MAIRSKYKQDGSFDGNYSDEWLQKNTNNTVKGELVKDWNTTNIIYNGNLISPIFNGTEWIENGSNEEEEQIKRKEKEYFKYLERQKEGVKRYLELSAEFRLNKLDGLITNEFHILLEDTLRPVRDEFVNGQYITSLEKLESIGSDIVGQQIYDKIHDSITQGIEEFYN